jgi:site-specific recombinase XerD
MSETHVEKTTSRLIDEFCSDILQEGISPITVRNYRCDLVAFANWFGARGRENFLGYEIRGTDISSYREEILKKFKPPTVNRKLASIRRWVRWRGDCSDLLKKAEPVPIQKFPPPSKKRRCLSQKEEQRLLRSARKYGDPFHFAAILMMLRMGLRVSELCSLCWGNVDLENGKIVLGRITRDFRELPLESACRVALSVIGGRHNSQREALVFSQAERPLTRRILERMLERYSRDAKIANLTLHVLRDTFATRKAQAGANAFHLATFLGHKRLDVMKRYLMGPDGPNRADFGDQTQCPNCVRRTRLSKRLKTDFSA